MSKYHLFWNGIFSQWHSSEFKYGDITFSCAEQFMMYYKAIFFNDHEIAIRVLNSSSPKAQKKLGRQVKNFDIDKWSKVAKDIVYTGSEGKYTQNPELCVELVSTYPKTLVEASPYDRIWGIGLSEYHPDALIRSKWKGENWLGLVLTELRNNIMNGNSYSGSADSTMKTIITLRRETIDLSRGS